MEITVEDRPDGVAVATLTGRMDIDGAAKVDMTFNVLGGSKKRLAVDLSGVEFIASMGLRTLMMCARAIASKHGRMALVAPQPGVEKVLRTSGVDEIIPIHLDLPSATEALTA